MGGLAGLAGLDAVQEQLGSVRCPPGGTGPEGRGHPRYQPGVEEPGDPGAGKSRTAGAAGGTCPRLGVLSSGHLTEVASADLAGTTSPETSNLVREAARRARGGVLSVRRPRKLADATLVSTGH